MSPLEDNSEFLKEKQEHPKYPKRKNISNSEEEQKKIDEIKNKNKKKKGGDQTSLF